jgi:arsenate reductase
MNLVQVLHNNRCTKSRNALALLEQKGIQFDVVNYLDGVLSEADIRSLLKKLDLKPEEIIRKSEAIYKEKYKGKSFTDTEWIQILQKEPKLIERPILYNQKTAVVGRPLENVEKFLKAL